MPLHRYLAFVLRSSLNVLPYLVIGLYPARELVRSRRAVVLSFLLLCVLDFARSLLIIAGVSQAILSPVALVCYAVPYIVVVRQPPGKSLFLVLCLANLDAAIRVMARGLEGLLFPSSTAEYAGGHFLLCLILMQIVVLTPLFFYLKNVYQPIIRRDTHRRLWKVLWLVPLTFQYIWFMHIYVYRNANPDDLMPPLEILNQLIVAAGAFFICHSIILYVDEQNKSFELQKKAYTNQLQQSQYNSMKNRVEETKRFKHDLKHHLRVISSYAGDGKLPELLAYVKQYESEVERRISTLYCDNYPVNALLQYFATIADKLGISPQIRVALPEEPPISNELLVVLFGNLLENALEAVGSMAEAAALEISSRIDRGFFYLQVSNSFAGSPPEYDADGLPRSTKSDASSHGIGLRSVYNLVQQHNGKMRTGCVHGGFSVHIMIPLPN